MRGLAQRLADSNLRLAVDTSVPSSLTVGRGQALCLGGWCYHPRERVSSLEMLVDGRPEPVKVRGLSRPDVARAHGRELDPHAHGGRSGFWTFVAFGPVEQRTSVELRLRATLSSGRRCSRGIGVLELQPNGRQHRTASTDRRGESGAPRVAICMTACNPPLPLFEAQVRSIREQTHRNWVCFVTDDCSGASAYDGMVEILGADARFRLHRNDARLGFYHNFERCLGLVAGDVDYVALSDHDDHWHPDKLGTLLARFRSGTTLVYSDMNIVDEEGRLIAGTYWTTRPNNHTRFDALLLANTVTGAASMFPRTLLEHLLPFPPPVGGAFHDHWIACVAMALGEVAYVDRPLYDYVQHRENVLGHFAPTTNGATAGVSRWWRGLRSADVGAAPQAFRLRALIARWRAAYLADVMRIQLIARTLELRCAASMSPRKRRALRRILRMDTFPNGFAWLAARGFRPLGPRNITLGAERKLAGAVLWRRLLHSRPGGTGGT